MATVKRKKLKLSEWLPSEETEQIAVFQWAAMMQGKEPRLALLNASMNGILTNAHFGAKLKRLGRKKGFPDINLPVPRHKPFDERVTTHLMADVSYGLYIELKKQSGGVVSPEQKWWHQQLTEMGYRVEVCKGAKAAIAAIEAYLK